MMTWALIPCSKTKHSCPCDAESMYMPSQLFRGAHQVATRAGQRVRIISAQYGVLWPEDEIAPYDKTLSTMPRHERREWALEVIRDLHAVMRPGDKVVSYLGATYAEYVLPALRRNGYVVEEPLRGLGQGKRLAWFKERLSA